MYVIMFESMSEQEKMKENKQNFNIIFLIEL